MEFVLYLSTTRVQDKANLESPQMRKLQLFSCM